MYGKSNLACANRNGFAIQNRLSKDECERCQITLSKFQCGDEIRYGTEVQLNKSWFEYILFICSRYYAIPQVIFLPI